MVVPKAKRSEATLRFIKNFKFKFCCPNSTYDRDRSQMNGDRDHGLDNDCDNYCPCHSPCDPCSSYADADRQCRRATSEVDHDYEDFLAWRDRSVDHSARRGFSEDDPLSHPDDDHRRRRLAMFRMGP